MAKSKLKLLGRGAEYALLVLVACLLYSAGFLARLDLPYLDWQMRLAREFRPQPAVNDVVVIGFDEAFVDGVPEPFALFHPHLAALLDAMRVAGPKLVAFDIALPDKSFHGLVPRDNPQFDFDQELLKAIGLAARDFPVILARTPDGSGKHLRTVHVPFLAAANRSPFLPAGMVASGSAVLCVDNDETSRRYPEKQCMSDQSLPPLAAVMAMVQGNRPAKQEWQGLIDYSVGPLYSPVMAREVIDALRRGDQAWLKQTFAGRAVLIGSVFLDDDRILSPVPLGGKEPQNARNPGIYVQAQIYRSLMNHGLIEPLRTLPMYLLLAASALFWFGALRIGKVVLLLVASGAAMVAVFVLLEHQIHLPAMALIAVAWVAFMLRAIFDAYEMWLERRRLESTFSGYVSPQLMRRLQSGEISPDQGGTKANVCVMFSDIIGFTKLSERLPPEQVVDFLNEYFAAMTSAIHRHGGTVDKFIGDGIMALFGQPDPLPFPEKSALEAAHEMLDKLVRLNRKWAHDRGFTISIGIGIHSGEAILGFLGSRKRHDFTAIGDTVNATSRLEGLTRPLDYPIICSAQIASALGNPDFLVDLGEQAIKGHSAMHVFGWKPPLGRG